MQHAFEDLIAPAEIRVNGDRPWDIQVHNEALYTSAFTGGTLALGEAYVNGWWDCEALDVCVARALRARVDEGLHSWQAAWNVAKARLLNLQSPSRAFEVGRDHYDIGNDLFERMLDRRMIYSCGYWRNATTLDEAQTAKLDLVCRKLRLASGQRVLDIGCGWGGFAQYAAQEYGVEVVGLTVSEEQADLARERCAGLPVEIRLQDYREVDEPFDRVVSIGMFEHVGYKNHRAYMETVHRCLKPDGLSLLHTIGANKTRRISDPWIEKYIFPNGNTPSAAQIAEAAEGLFVIEDWHNFGADYDRTLMAWHRNFACRWPEIADRYGDRFYRIWRYYLLACAGTFRARRNQLWQIVLSPQGVMGGYRREC